MTRRITAVDRAVAMCTAELRKLRREQERLESARLGSKARINQQMERMFAGFDDQLRALAARMATPGGSSDHPSTTGMT